MFVWMGGWVGVCMSQRWQMQTMWRQHDVLFVIETDPLVECMPAVVCIQHWHLKLKDSQSNS